MADSGKYLGAIHAQILAPMCRGLRPVDAPSILHAHRQLSAAPGAQPAMRRSRSILALLHVGTRWVHDCRRKFAGRRGPTVGAGAYWPRSGSGGEPGDGSILWRVLHTAAWQDGAAAEYPRESGCHPGPARAVSLPCNRSGGWIEAWDHGGHVTLGVFLHVDGALALLLSRPAAWSLTTSTRKTGLC